jgi:hypothetical protein
MLLKRSSKPAHQGFKRKRLDVMGTFQEVKAKIGQGALPPGTKMTGVPSNAQAK